MTSCPKCGKELHETPSMKWDSCPWCGADLAQFHAYPPPVSQPQASIPRPWTDPFYGPSSKPRSHRRDRVIIVTLLIGLVVLTILGVPVLLHRSLSSILPLNLSPVREKRAIPYWAGYKTQYLLGSIVYAGANWTVPVLTCPSSPASISGAESVVGISGGNSVTDSFPRAGIEYDCNYSTPGYQVFYGWDRGLKYSISDVQAKAGDVVSVTVQWVQSKFVITIDDSLEGWRVDRENSTFPATPTRADAEWMVAAVSVNGPNTPLTNFTQVFYTRCYASNGGSLGTMGSFSLTQYTMVSNGAAIKARPVYGGDGTSFSVQWISPGP